ncbi:hypothetical protein JOB18_010585 [Solea senegalensis]|uniref:Thy-1 membrane glycoprotein-like n=1 Tax=Solea senegalensis TaxID=28829 RepID=A0AAV6SH83_SOLSE|nr:thy-1 membrane glycoprotein-like [Solea senegalensis]KAG7515521.1 thy-1 membrane glycoprotein-like [Solea senegalensis]KAG7515522.1 hypothetical protein JOB18_010585 [Solea senegalensis]KAG7515523.1 hypothetical protein JOB18_010585 [Solea senegalensis]
MLSSVCVTLFGILGVLLIPGHTQVTPISVCVEDDRDLRVDCRIEAMTNKFDSYEFSWSSGTRESLINTNVSGSSAESQFKDKSYVEPLQPHGYRLTLSSFTDTARNNTTYMCKINGKAARISVEADQLAPCSAVSLFLKTSCVWIVSLLFFFYHCQS